MLQTIDLPSLDEAGGHITPDRQSQGQQARQPAKRVKSEETEQRYIKGTETQVRTVPPTT